jgi:hypothetical protein
MIIKPFTLIAITLLAFASLSPINVTAATDAKALSIMNNKGVTHRLLLDVKQQNKFHFLWNTKKPFKPRTKAQVPAWQYRVNFDGKQFNYHPSGFVQPLNVNRSLHGSAQRPIFKISAALQFNQLLAIGK